MKSREARTPRKSGSSAPRSRQPGSRTRATTSLTLAPDVIEQWATTALRSLGVPRRDAATIARSLVQTSLWGVDSHGIARLGHYFARLKAGSITARPRIHVGRTGPCTAQIDGDHGHGIVVCHRATDTAINLARKNGLAAVGVANSSHCGAMAVYGRKIAAAGLVGIVFTHSDAFVAPHGGTKKFLGTNPICITIPTRNPDEPLCLDMATSAVPFNRVMNCRRENRPLQPGWALDARGRPTIDPHAVACLLPLAGHKGYALAFMIDLLCGPLNGMPFGPHIPPMYTALSRRRHLGSFFIAIDPARFAGGSGLPAAATRMAREARAQSRAGADRPVLAPGDPELACARQRARDGIPIEPGLRDELTRWSRRLGVPTPFDQIASGGNLGVRRSSLLSPQPL